MTKGLKSSRVLFYPQADKDSDFVGVDAVYLVLLGIVNPKYKAVPFCLIKL